MKPIAPLLFKALLFVTVTVLFFSCQKNGADSLVAPPDNPPNTSTDVQVFKDVQYGVNKGFDEKDVDLKFDAYIPAYTSATQKFPLVLFVHGGGFTSGDKSNGSASMVQFAKSGFVGVTINYRLNTAIDGDNMCSIPIRTTNESIYMAVQDTRAALRFLVANAGKYHIDTSNIFLNGNSAGAITVLNTHFLNQADFEEMIPGVQLTRGGLNNAGNDLINTFTIKGIAANSGCLNDTKYIKSSNLLPVIFFHGTEDKVIPIETGHIYSGDDNSCTSSQIVFGSAALYQTLVQLGEPSVLHIDPVGGHLSFSENLTNSNELCFFNSVMNKITESGIYTGQESSCK